MVAKAAKQGQADESPHTSCYHDPSTDMEIIDSLSVEKIRLNSKKAIAKLGKWGNWPCAALHVPEPNILFEAAAAWYSYLDGTVKYIFTAVRNCNIFYGAANVGSF